jgi:hypothetical protein
VLVSISFRKQVGWSFGGAVALMVAGVLLNRVLDLQVSFFFPGSMISNLLAPFKRASPLLRFSIVVLNLAIWAAVIWLLLAIGGKHQREPPPATGARPHRRS